MTHKLHLNANFFHLSGGKWTIKKLEKEIMRLYMENRSIWIRAQVTMDDDYSSVTLMYVNY